MHLKYIPTGGMDSYDPIYVTLYGLYFLPKYPKWSKPAFKACCTVRTILNVHLKHFKNISL